MMYLWENTPAYTLIESGWHMLVPVREIIQFWVSLSEVADKKQLPIASNMEANFKLMERLTKVYPKPEFHISKTTVNRQEIDIVQKTLLTKPFCHLVHFKKAEHIDQPKMLVVAPMSGHHATLLRNTIESLLPFFDVYVTDWIDAKHVPLSDGKFDMDDSINYIIEFLEFLAPNVNVLAVCQPAVTVLAAVSIMADEGNAKVPNSMIVMGGPIDTRRNPTEVNVFALQRNIGWFESRLITRVPINYPGVGRAVYPGLFQLAGFMWMNPKRHAEAHMEYYKAVINGDDEKMKHHCKFYDEYFAVMDLTAEFYLQTIKVVFKEHALPLGNMVSRGRKVNPAAIRKTALLGIEGEHDDIAGRGQTEAALELCINIPKEKRKYHLQKDVGHYGVFSGKRFREEIVPIIKEFVYKVSK